MSPLGVGRTKSHNESQLAAQTKSHFVLLCIKNDPVEVRKRTLCVILSFFSLSVVKVKKGDVAVSC